MIVFDFMSPYIIYGVYIILTLSSIVLILLKPQWFIKHETKLAVIAFVVLLYSQVIRYGIPYLDGNPTMPFYLSRLASIFVLVFLIKPSPKLYGFVFFYASTSLFPVFAPAGPIETIRIHNESFFIDHYVVTLLPYYLLSVKSYKPSFKDGVFALIPLGLLILAFVPINELMNWGYFFMNRHNVLLNVFPNMSWTVFAVLFITGIGIWYSFFGFICLTYLSKKNS